MSKHAQKARFGIIGVINTALDFGLLFLLTHIGLPAVGANYISTATAFVFSFFANRSYTFKASSGRIRRHLALFFVVTFFGLWVLQPIVLLGTDRLFASSGLSAAVTLLIGKLLASVVTLTWNYIFYSRVVFNSPDTETRRPS